MADSSVAITAGSGTAIDTRTEGTNSNHRQVIVIGDPATNAGAELHVTKKRSHKLNATRHLKAGERFLHIRPTAARFARTYRLEAQGATLGMKFGQVGIKHRDAVASIAWRQEQTNEQMAAVLAELNATKTQLKRLKDDNDAMQLLLLAA